MSLPPREVLRVGEVRDDDTARMALRAAMTGHQVFTTLHCNDALGALPRLVDLGLRPPGLPPVAWPTHCPTCGSAVVVEQRSDPSGKHRSWTRPALTLPTFACARPPRARPANARC